MDLRLDSNYKALQRIYLEEEEAGRRNCFISKTGGVGALRWIKICGVCHYWDKNEFAGPNESMKLILSGINSPGSAAAFLLKGSRRGFELYMGVSEDRFESLQMICQAHMPGVEIKALDEPPTPNADQMFGGIINGYPAGSGIRQRQGSESASPAGDGSHGIDKICRGMQGCSFTLLVLAKSISFENCKYTQRILYDEVDQCSSAASMTSQQEYLGVSRQYVDTSLQKYLEDLNKMGEMLEQGSLYGLWNCNYYYLTNSTENERKLRGLLKSAYAGGGAGEQITCIPVSTAEDGGNITIKELFSAMAMIRDEAEQKHPLGTLFKFKYQTIMDSAALACFFALPTKEIPGFYIDDYVVFDTAMRGGADRNFCIGAVAESGRSHTLLMENPYGVELNDLTRHALVVGVTGGGKTNTMKSLLSELYLKHHVPFLVIESAKREYIELMNLQGMEELAVFTLGNEGEDGVPYRINPFEVAGAGNTKASLQAHIDSVLATFKASFELYAPMPYVLETAVFEIYTDRGWIIETGKNRFGWDEYPTLTDLYFKIDEVVDRLGYHMEVQSNVKAALKARIQSLRIAGKGAMLDTPRSIPLDLLLKTPTILELEDLGDDDTKSFVMGILFIQLYEYRRTQMDGQSKELQHILVVEEAHRLLKNVPEGGEGNSAKASSVTFFCNMLAEIRTFGQGIFIADQIPTKLAGDTIKNTNLKIVHRTVMKEDREVMGQAMNMTPEQMDYLSSLTRGYAAVYSEGDNRPKLVLFPLMEDSRKGSRTSLIQNMKSSLGIRLPDYWVRYRDNPGCLYCRCRGKQCEDVDCCFGRLTREQTDYLIKYLEEQSTVHMLENVLLTMEKQYLNRPLDCGSKICMAGKILKRTSLNMERQLALCRGLARKYSTVHSENGE